MNLILASASPRRREILCHLGLRPTIRHADVDESSDERDGTKLVELLACRKAIAVYEQLKNKDLLPNDSIILAADTVVLSPDGEILGKPKDEDDAARMLRCLSGRTHRVISGIALLHCADGQYDTAHETTEVEFSTLSEDVITRYIATGEPMDKAGAYGIQDTAALWIRAIRGDYFNVVGLPLHRLETLLQEKFGESLFQG